MQLLYASIGTQISFFSSLLLILVAALVLIVLLGLDFCLSHWLIIHAGHHGLAFLERNVLSVGLLLDSVSIVAHNRRGGSGRHTLRVVAEPRRRKLEVQMVDLLVGSLVVCLQHFVRRAIC